jgi:thiamine biosynthesis lipoprotein
MSSIPSTPRAYTRRELFTLGRSSSGDEGRWIRVQRTAMACRFEILLWDDEAHHAVAAREALDEADRIESALTVFRDTSDLVRVNREAAEAPTAVDEDLFALLSQCRALHEATERAFDVTSTPLSRCWGFLERDGRLPAPEAIEAARAQVGMEKVELDPALRTVRFARPGLELNLGSIGKGFALGRMAASMRARGVTDALLSAGGSSAVAVGGRGNGWLVDVRSRRASAARLARLRLRDGALATSGAGEQFFETGGRRYGHVLDPRTGWPAAGTLSVSVVCQDAAAADALSTAFLVGGLNLARRYCATHAETLALVTPDDGSERPVVVGAYAGAVLEEA